MGSRPLWKVCLPEWQGGNLARSVYIALESIETVDYKDLTTLIVKVFGALIVVHILSLVPSYTTDAIMAFDGWFTILRRTVLPLIFPLSVGLLMLCFPGTLTNKLIRGEKLSGLPTYLPQLERIALTILGFFLLFSTVSDLGFHISRLMWAHEVPTASWRKLSEVPADIYGAIVGSSIGLLVSIWFILGSGGILRVVSKLRGRD